MIMYFDGVQNLEVRSVYDGYYFAETIQPKNYELILQKIESILKQKLTYTSCLYDDERAVFIPPNRWQGSEFQTLRSIAEHANRKLKNKRKSLLNKIEQLIHEKIHASTSPEVVEARELGYPGYDKEEAAEFTEEFKANIEYLLNVEDCLSRIVNTKTVVYQGRFPFQKVNVLETLRNIRKLHAADLSDNEIRQFPWGMYCSKKTPGWWFVHFLILSGIRPGKRILIDAMSFYLNIRMIKSAENLLRYSYENKMIKSTDLEDGALLLKAISADAQNFLRRVIDYGVNVNTTHEGSGLMNWALLYSRHKIANFLIGRGALPNDDQIILNALYINAEYWFIKLLIERGANIHCCGFLCNNPLIVALANKLIPIAMLLIECGAAVNYRNKPHESALTYALKHPHELDPIRLLLDNGAIPNDHELAIIRQHTNLFNKVKLI